MIKGYIKNEISYIDSVQITVNNDKDLLNLNWEDIYSGVVNEIYYKSDFSDSTFGGTYKLGGKPTPFLLSYLQISEDIIKTQETSLKEKQILYDLIVDLYGDPLYSKNNNSNINELFYNLFTLTDNYIFPQDIIEFIWITEVNKIVLFAKPHSQRYDYSVIFERK